MSRLIVCLSLLCTSMMALADTGPPASKNPETIVLRFGWPATFRAHVRTLVGALKEDDKQSAMSYLTYDLSTTSVGGQIHVKVDDVEYPNHPSSPALEMQTLLAQAGGLIFSSAILNSDGDFQSTESSDDILAKIRNLLPQLPADQQLIRKAAESFLASHALLPVSQPFLWNVFVGVWRNRVITVGNAMDWPFDSTAPLARQVHDKVLSSRLAPCPDSKYLRTCLEIYLGSTFNSLAAAVDPNSSTAMRGLIIVDAATLLPYRFRFRGAAPAAFNEDISGGTFIVDIIFTYD